jgi:hypothetical protein
MRPAKVRCNCLTFDFLLLRSPLPERLQIKRHRSGTLLLLLSAPINPLQSHQGVQPREGNARWFSHSCSGAQGQVRRQDVGLRFIACHVNAARRLK